jgi:hypothetical protein
MVWANNPEQKINNATNVRLPDLISISASVNPIESKGERDIEQPHWVCLRGSTWAEAFSDR